MKYILFTIMITGNIIISVAEELPKTLGEYWDNLWISNKEPVDNTKYSTYSGSENSKDL